VIVLRFEADSGQALARIQAEFRSNLSRIMPNGQLPF
jgi:phosphomannomutase/phosphoglucomutase